MNLAIWGLFSYLVLRRRWTRVSLAVALLHMLVITPMGIAPLRALTERGTFKLGLGWLQVQGATAAFPALMIWIWGLSVAIIALVRPRGRALAVIAAGDLVLAGNFGTYFTVSALQGALREFRAQGGEFITVSGFVTAAVLLLSLVVPFTFSAWWAIREMRP